MGRPVSTAPASVTHMGYLNIMDQYPGTATGSDDIAAVNGTLASAISQGLGVYAPTGVYLCSAAVNIGNATNHGTVQGFMLRGDGDGFQSGHGGTAFKYTGPRIETGIINIFDTINQSGAFENFGVFAALPSVTANPMAAKYGILLNSSNFNSHAFRNISANGVECGYALLAGGGANGETMDFHRCRSSYSRGFFYCDNGQAFSPNFYNCAGLMWDPGNTYFHFVSGTGNIVGFNGSTARYSPGLTSNTTLIRNDSSFGYLNVVGGRIEQCTQVYNRPQGTDDAHCVVNIEGMHFVVDNDLASSTNTIKSFIRCSGPELINFRGCHFVSQAAETGRTTNVESVNCSNGAPLYNYGSLIVFDGCVFNGTNENPMTGGLFAGAAQSKFRSSRWFPLGSNTPSYLDN